MKDSLVHFCDHKVSMPIVYAIQDISVGILIAICFIAWLVYQYKINKK